MPAPYGIQIYFKRALLMQNNLKNIKQPEPLFERHIFLSINLQTSLCPDYLGSKLRILIPSTNKRQS